MSKSAIMERCVSVVEPDLVLYMMLIAYLSSLLWFKFRWRGAYLTQT